MGKAWKCERHSVWVQNAESACWKCRREEAVQAQPVPADPSKPYELNANDRRFLKSLRIEP
jgi:hypothetical protein